MPWTTQGEITNPAASQVLADTGPLPPGTTYQPQIVVSTTANMRFLLERRNPANSASVQSHAFRLAANQTFDLGLLGNLDPWTDGERIRIISSAAQTLTCQASIFY